MLRFDISERTVLRWMRKASRDTEPARRWAAFLNNHREAIAAMGFFTVPALTFGVLYCFFVIAHDRRRILHCNVTRHPTTAWVAQQLREAFPCRGLVVFIIVTNSQSDLLRSTLAPAKSKPPGEEWVFTDETSSILRLSSRESQSPDGPHPA